MSAPARSLPRTRPRRATGGSHRPRLRPVPSPAPSRAAARRRRRAVAYLVFAGTVLVLMVLGLVVLNVIVAQSSFRLDDLSRRVGRLTRQAEENRLEVARLSAPTRIAKEAERLGLRLPDPAEVVHLWAEDGKARDGEAP